MLEEQLCVPSYTGGCASIQHSKHDKACGGLFGMVPLVRGMPVFLTNHLDRFKKAMLRGRPGTLLDWELNEHEPHV